MLNEDVTEIKSHIDDGHHLRPTAHASMCYYCETKLYYVYIYTYILMPKIMCAKQQFLQLVECT